MEQSLWKQSPACCRHAFNSTNSGSKRTSRSIRFCLNASAGFDYDGQAVPTPVLGNRVEKWLKTPLDILSFGPRAAVGALVSLPERAQKLQEDMDRVNMLLQDPRPLEDKRDELAKEVETVLVEFVEKGAGVEADVLANVVALLPPDLRDQLPEEVQLAVGRAGAPAASAPSPSSAPVVEYVPMPAATLETNQIAAEMADLRESVRELRGTIDALAAKKEPAQDKVLRLNVREAKSSTSLRVQQLSPATLASMDDSIVAAIKEARALLADIDSLGI